MDPIFIIIFFVVGAVLGSFLSAFTYRFPRGISVAKGLSYCDKCKVSIKWYDNIPLISYLLLKGKCRNCHASISLRYPLIEFSTGVIFVLIYIFLYQITCGASSISAVCVWKNLLANLSLPYLSLISLIFIAIFIIDAENQFIPDELVFFSILLNILVLLFSSVDRIYLYLFSGFLAAFLLLCLHLITKGKGMGLGDVKLAISIGLILGWPLTPVWLMASFIIGGIVGSILLILGKVNLGKHIAFGPFMIASFFIMLFWGDNVLRLTNL